MSWVEDYYAGKNILVTGGTGLVGKVLVESILRKLPEVGTLYLLIRPGTEPDGRPRPPERRLRREILGSSAFDHLRAVHGDGFDAFVRPKIRVVGGDLSEPRLGLSADAYETLRSEVDVILNSGAVAVFQAPLDVALETNAVGPRRVLELARDASRHPFVAHVSTCYVSKLRGPVFETRLDPAAVPHRAGARRPFDADEEVRTIRARVARIRERGATGPLRPLQREREAWMRQRLVREGLRWSRRRGWNDTYTFTKALGEQLFVRHRGEVPGLILRPSIIESSLRTPAPGWMDGFRMLDPLIVAFARGQLFEFPGNPESVLDVVPADVVVNALLVAVPWTHERHERDGPRMYQVASGMENPLKLKELHGYLLDHFRRVPLGRNGDGELPRLTFPETRHFLRQLAFKYMLPLRALEWLASLLRFTPWGERRHARLRSRRSALERLRHYARIYGPYAECQARFLTFHVRQMWDALAAEVRERFPFDVREIDWRRYVQEVHVPGIKLHLLGIPPEGGARRDGRRGRGARAAADGDGRRNRGADGRPDGAGGGAGGQTGTRGAGTAAARADAPAATGGGAHIGGEREDGGAAVGYAPASIATATAAPSVRPSRTSGAAEEEGTEDWRKAERVLRLTEELDPREVRRWIGRPHKRLLRSAACRVIRAICRRRLKLECTGREHIPERGPFIVVSNHTSHVDTGVLLAALGRLAPRVHAAAATDYWFRNPVFGWFLHTTLGAIPFDRHAHSISKALALPSELLRNGRSLIFYPEGGRSETGELRPFKSAIGLLALASVAPVLPVYIHGAYQVMPKGGAFIRRHPVRVSFGPARPVEPYLARLDRESVSDLARRLADDVHAAVERLRERAAEA